MSALPGSTDARITRRRTSSERLDQAVRLYRRRIDRCSTENQRNRVHIEVANYLTPMELRHFAAAVADELPDSQSRLFIAGLNDLMPIKTAREVEFERRGLCKGATVYTGGCGSREQKTVILAFASFFHRLGIPTPCVLDCLDATLYDVIMLRDFSQAFFSRGIPGLGNDFFSLLANLRKTLPLDTYRNRVAIGTSSGGLPALLAAIELKMNRGVCIGGMDFGQFCDKLKSKGVSEERYLALLASRPDPFPELLLVFGSGYAVDATAAAALQRLVPSQLMAVENCHGHTVLANRLRHGRLPSFMAAILGQTLSKDETTMMPAPADRARPTSFERRGTGS